MNLIRTGAPEPRCMEDAADDLSGKTIVAVLAAVAGALGAVAIYLRRREKELDEYERLLFGEDDAATVEDTAEPAEAAEEAPAEDKAE